MKTVLSAFLALLLITTAQAKASKIPYSQRSDVYLFIEEMVKNHKFDKKQLTKLFDTVEADPGVIEKMNHPYEAMPWKVYRPHFVNDKMIRNGVKYWGKHQKDLEKAAKTYGVPAEVIVAIIGVETAYGTNKGNYPAFRTLSTLAFNYPKRGDFFKKELRDYLLLTRESKFNPAKLKGSYAGALGVPQFMPSSYRSYAVDFSGNGKKDLLNDPADTIGSIANYLKQHGWVGEQRIAVKATTPDKKPDKKIQFNKPKLRYSTARLKPLGIMPAQPLTPHTQVIPLQLEGPKSDEYWLGLHNFYVISRYNNSALYVMAVYELSEAIKHSKMAQKKAKMKNS